MSSVALQIVDELRPRRGGRVAAGYPQPRQAGITPVGVKVKTIVVAAPNRTDGSCLLQHHRLKAQHIHARCTGKARRTRTDNDGVWTLHVTRDHLRVGVLRHPKSASRLDWLDIQRPRANVTLPRTGAGSS